MDGEVSLGVGGGVVTTAPVEDKSPQGTVLCRTSPGLNHQLEREAGGILSFRVMWSVFCVILSAVRGLEEGRGSEGRRRWR